MNSILFPHTEYCQVFPTDFLAELASERGVSAAEQEALLNALSGLSTSESATKLGISGDALRRRLSEVYQKFEIKGSGPGKLAKLQQKIQELYQDLPASTSDYKIERGPLSVDDSSNRTTDLAELPEPTEFYGREAEFRDLNKLLSRGKTKLIALYGMAGIGKSYLAAKLAKAQRGRKFDRIIWRSLRKSPPISAILPEIFGNWQNGTETFAGSDEAIIDRTIDYCRNNRCLLIFDDWQFLFREHRLVGDYADESKIYGELLSSWVEERHDSCLMVLSQDEIHEVTLLEAKYRAFVRVQKLKGLNRESARKILADRQLSSERYWDVLIDKYRGNPLMLSLTAVTIEDVFCGDVEEFLQASTLAFDIERYIGKIIARLSDDEKLILKLVAGKEKPISIKHLQLELGDSDLHLPDVLASLRKRSLMEVSIEGYFLPQHIRLYQWKMH